MRLSSPLSGPRSHRSRDARVVGRGIPCEKEAHLQRDPLLSLIHGRRAARKEAIPWQRSCAHLQVDGADPSRGHVVVVHNLVELLTPRALLIIAGLSSRSVPYPRNADAARLRGCAIVPSFD